MPFERVGVIEEIWRYPVSSLGGERLTRAEIDFGGIFGDRTWCLIDAATGKPATPESDSRWRTALFLRSRLSDRHPEIEFINGRWVSVTDPTIKTLLNDHFAFPVEVRPYRPTASIGDTPTATNRYKPSPVHLLTTASLDKLSSLTGDSANARRFRPTLLLRTESPHGFVESEWLGQDIQVGSVSLKGMEETKRCGMTLAAQPGIDENPEVLRAIVRSNRRNLGIYCDVVKPGPVSVGDAVTV